MGTVVAACGDDEETAAGSSEPAATPTPEKKIKIGMVTDIGGLDDRSFNQSAYKGLKRAESELGAEIRALTSKSNADYVPNLSTLARQQYDLVDRRRLPDGRGDREGRERVPDDEVRDHRLPAGGDEVEAEERLGPAVQGGRGRLPRRLHGRPVRRRTRAATRSSRRSAASRSRRSTPTSPATRRAPRTRTRTSRSSTATRRTSSTRRSARSSRSTRSPRARRSSSRSPAAAASARSTPPRRRASRASASTPTRATSATTS